MADAVLEGCCRSTLAVWAGALECREGSRLEAVRGSRQRVAQSLVLPAPECQERIFRFKIHPRPPRPCSVLFGKGTAPASFPPAHSSSLFGAPPPSPSTYPYQAVSCAWHRIAICGRNSPKSIGKRLQTVRGPISHAAFSLSAAHPRPSTRFLPRGPASPQNTRGPLGRCLVPPQGRPDAHVSHRVLWSHCEDPIQHFSGVFGSRFPHIRLALAPRGRSFLSMLPVARRSRSPSPRVLSLDVS